MKNFVSGLTIVGACVGVWFLFKIMWVLAAVLMPLLLLTAVLYLLGYYAPKSWHDAAENWLREMLNKMEFKFPAWTWGMIGLARGCLDWLGMRVKKQA